MNSEYKKLTEEIAALKDKALNIVLNDTSTTKLEKLKFISQEKIWDYSRYINHEFPEWEQECKDKNTTAAISDGKVVGRDYICDMTDTCFDPSHMDHEKYTQVSYIDSIENLEYEVEMTDEQEAEFKKTGLYPKEVTMVIVTSRGEYNTKLYKPVQEVIDVLCDYCFANKIIGYTNDW